MAGKNYLINEGNQIGYMDASFDDGLNLVQKKLVAGADIEKGQIVIVSDDMTVIPSDGSSKCVLGVAMFDCKAGEPIAVECEGLMRLTASATITAPAEIESAADGKVKTAADGKVIGIALSDASADGDVIVKLSV